MLSRHIEHEFGMRSVEAKYREYVGRDAESSGGVNCIKGNQDKSLPGGSAIVQGIAGGTNL